MEPNNNIISSGCNAPSGSINVLQSTTTTSTVTGVSGNISLTYGGSTTGTTYSDILNYPNGTTSFVLPGNMPSFSTFPSSTLTLNNIIMQNKVAVFQVVRDEDDKIIKTEFIKELWVATKNGVSVEFQVARDKDLAEYDASELVIRTISTVSF
jgi:hypothetical protein